MQVYKVIKTEHVRKRPKWLMRFLIKIPIELYEETTSTETAAGNLRAIGQLVLDSGVLEKRKGLQLQQRDDVVSIHSSRGRMYVRFSISECR